MGRVRPPRGRSRRREAFAAATAPSRRCFPAQPPTPRSAVHEYGGGAGRRPTTGTVLRREGRPAGLLRAPPGRDLAPTDPADDACATRRTALGVTGPPRRARTTGRRGSRPGHRVRIPLDGPAEVLGRRAVTSWPSRPSRPTVAAWPGWLGITRHAVGCHRPPRRRPRDGEPTTSRAVRTARPCNRVDRGRTSSLYATIPKADGTSSVAPRRRCAAARPGGRRHPSGARGYSEPGGSRRPTPPGSSSPSGRTGPMRSSRDRTPSASVPSTSPSTPAPRSTTPRGRRCSSRVRTRRRRSASGSSDLDSGAVDLVTGGAARGETNGCRRPARCRRTDRTVRCTLSLRPPQPRRRPRDSERRRTSCSSTADPPRTSAPPVGEDGVLHEPGIGVLDVTTAVPPATVAYRDRLKGQWGGGRRR